MSTVESMAWTSPPLPGHLSVEGEPPFVGRRAELKTIEDAWQRVESGQPQTIFIGGEPGVGKTRLVSEGAVALRRAGAAVLSGASFAETDVPYQPFVRCLDHLFDHTPAGSLADIIPDSSAHLARLAPSVTRHRDDSTEPERGNSEQRSKLFAAYTDLLEAIAQDRPVVLVLEDLHWARESTRLLLSFLVERAESSRMLILATHRATAPDRSDALAANIARLYRLPGVHRIDLAGLDVTDITQFIMLKGHQPLAEARSEAAVLRDRTGGNPFFVRELLSQPGHQPRKGASSAPESVQAAVSARLAHFDTDTLYALGLAAALGDEFDSSTLIAAVGDTEVVLRSIDLAKDSGLISGQPGNGARRFRFRHSLSRQAVLNQMSTIERTKAHGVVAQAIEEVWPASPRKHAALAHHYRSAATLGFGDAAAEHATIAGRHAEETLAYEDAARWFLLAAEVESTGDREEALLSAGQNFALACDFGKARGMYEQVVDSSDPTRMARAAVGMDDASWRSGNEGHRSVALVVRALEGIDADPTNPLYVRLLASKARVLAYSGKDSALLAKDAMDAARAIGDPALVVETLGCAVVNRVLVSSSVHESIQLSRELIELSTSLHDHDRTALGAAVLGGFAYTAGQPEVCEQADAELSRAIEAGDLRFWEPLLGCGRFVRHFTRGDLKSARDQARDLLSLSDSLGSDAIEGPYGIQMFMVEREAGRLAAAGTVIDQIGMQKDIWRPGFLALLIELGRLEAASKLLGRVFEEEMSKETLSADRPAVVALLAEAVLALENVEFAADLRPVLLEYSGLNLMAGNRVVVFGAADRYIGQIDSLLELPSADRYFEAAVALDVATKAPLHEAESLIAYAAHLQESVDHKQLARAAEFRHRARNIAESRALVRQLARLDTSTTIRSDRPAGLTPREVEVLRLAAEGLSNKEIAARLFISENTAANHMRSILLKTQAPNRTKAAIFAAEYGLLG